MRPGGTLVVAALASLATTAGAQQYRARLDATAQSVEFRGLVPDSILAAAVVEGAGGGPVTPDGFAVRCSGGQYCHYFRSGPTLRGAPISAGASVVLWGFGIDGLRFRASGRVIHDLERGGAWPGSDPAAQVHEAYAEYERGSLTARGGRQLVTSRLESIGFDGAWARARLHRASLELTGYGGWGLGQATAVVASSPALNPIDDWRPRDRQHVAGLEAAWVHGDADVRAEYRREIDPRDGNFVSERAAVSLAASRSAWRATAGFDYNLAEARFGSADATVTYLQPRYAASLGARRYRPYFSLWTLWGAYSPVPYHAVNATTQWRVTEHVSVRARAERYAYDDAGVSTPLVRTLEDRGWRTSVGASSTVGASWRLDAEYAAEFGPGASGRYVEGAVEYTPGTRLALGVHGGVLRRPLELRFSEARTRWLGARADVTIGPDRRVWAEVSVADDRRDRPDAGASSLDQRRLRTGITLLFGARADRTALPPARRQP